ncbi:MAG: hypothetical protein NTU53_19995 [Planctomycetota bacterium]|nr:hypothetical protein [Planctomycetota bacterium]
MPNMPGTTRRQTVFLRSFLKNPAGPSPADWPSAPILRRWLRRPAFLRALNTIRQTLHFQSDLLLAFAASSSSNNASATPTNPSTIAKKPNSPAARTPSNSSRPAKPSPPSTPHDSHPTHFIPAEPLNAPPADP